MVPPRGDLPTETAPPWGTYLGENYGGPALTLAGVFASPPAVALTGALVVTVLAGATLAMNMAANGPDYDPDFGPWLQSLPLALFCGCGSK